MLERPIAQNKAACENQGNQRELSNYGKSIKMLFLKKSNWGCRKKIQKDSLKCKF